MLLNSDNYLLYISLKDNGYLDSHSKNITEVEKRVALQNQINQLGKINLNSLDTRALDLLLDKQTEVNNILDHSYDKEHNYGYNK